MSAVANIAPFPAVLSLERRNEARCVNLARTGSAAVEEDREEGTSADAALVERVRAGDSQAFELLVRRHLGVAHGLARRLVGGDPDDADDVVQDAFIHALQRIDQLSKPRRFRSWFLTIVRNRAHSFRDYQALRNGPPLEHAAAVADAADPSRRVEESELRQELEAAMKELTELQRGVFRRHDLEGWDHGEIAEELGISRGSSRVHLHVARKAVRRHLSTYPLAWSRR